MKFRNAITLALAGVIGLFAARGSDARPAYSGNSAISHSTVTPEDEPEAPLISKAAKVVAGLFKGKSKLPDTAVLLDQELLESVSPNAEGVRYVFVSGDEKKGSILVIGEKLFAAVDEASISVRPLGAEGEKNKAFVIAFADAEKGRVSVVLTNVSYITEAGKYRNGHGDLAPEDMAIKDAENLQSRLRFMTFDHQISLPERYDVHVLTADSVTGLPYLNGQSLYDGNGPQTAYLGTGEDIVVVKELHKGTASFLMASHRMNRENSLEFTYGAIADLSPDTLKMESAIINIPEYGLDGPKLTERTRIIFSIGDARYETDAGEIWFDDKVPPVNVQSILARPGISREEGRAALEKTLRQTMEKALAYLAEEEKKKSPHPDLYAVHGQGHWLRWLEKDPQKHRVDRNPLFEKRERHPGWRDQLASEAESSPFPDQRTP